MEDREGSQSMVIFDSIAERKRKKSERERKKNRGKIYWGKAVRDIYFHWRPSHEYPSLIIVRKGETIGWNEETGYVEVDGIRWIKAHGPAIGIGMHLWIPFQQSNGVLNFQNASPPGPGESQPGIIVDNHTLPDLPLDTKVWYLDQSRQIFDDESDEDSSQSDKPGSGLKTPKISNIKSLIGDNKKARVGVDESIPLTDEDAVRRFLARLYPESHKLKEKMMKLYNVRSILFRLPELRSHHLIKEKRDKHSNEIWEEAYFLVYRLPKPQLKGCYLFADKWSKISKAVKNNDLSNVNALTNISGLRRVKRVPRSQKGFQLSFRASLNGRPKKRFKMMFDNEIERKRHMGVLKAYINGYSLIKGQF